MTNFVQNISVCLETPLHWSVLIDKTFIMNKKIILAFAAGFLFILLLSVGLWLGLRQTTTEKENKKGKNKGTGHGHVDVDV